MGMLHCTDCIYGSFEQNPKTGRWRGTCERRYTLADPHVYPDPGGYFADDPTKLVPMVDPWGKEYLRTSDICNRYIHLSELDKKRESAFSMFSSWRKSKGGDRGLWARQKKKGTK